MDILILFLLFLLYPIQAYKSEYHSEYLSLETGKRMRGFFAIVVILHHIANVTESGKLFRLFTYAGVYAVAVFFFYSGYGLQKSFLTKENYARHFLIKRLSPILIPYLLISVIYYIVWKVDDSTFSVHDFFNIFISGSNSWYVLCIVCFYVFFYITMLICREKRSNTIIGACVFEISWLVMRYALSPRKVWWFNTPHILILGIIWAVYEKQIIRFQKSRYWIILCTAGILFMAETALRPKTQIAGTIISTTAFVILLNQILLKINTKSKILLFLGDISYEIYILHGIFISILRRTHIQIANDFLYAVLVFAGSIFTAWLFHPLFKKITKSFLQLKVKS